MPDYKNANNNGKTVTMKKIVTISLTTAVLCGSAMTVLAAGGDTKLKHIPWTFNGIFGTFDRQAIQRGYQVYTEVCAGCHSLKRVAFRNLAEVGFSEAEIKAIAKEASVVDGPNDDGEMFERPGIPSDRFVPPFPNEKAARASNGGAFPPDLSLITKARVKGPDYLYSLLTGYEDAPESFSLPEGKYYNSAFPGYAISMAPPLSTDAVEYQDGTPASLDQMSQDLVHFLQWSAEPEMEKRKQMGLKVMIFMLIVTGLFAIAKKRTWAKLKESK